MYVVYVCSVKENIFLKRSHYKDQSFFILLKEKKFIKNKPSKTENSIPYT